MSKQSEFGHWSRYWQTGHISSLPQDFPAVYDGEIEAFWKELAHELPEGADVLDVCSGNGPVALLIARHAETARISAADAAAVAPDRALQLHPELAARISFLPETLAEELESLEARYDLVTSQYGVEYTDWPATARAISAILKPGGHLALITHVPTSAMIEMMEAERAEYDTLAKTGVLQAMRVLGQSDKVSPSRKGLKRALIQLRTQARSSQLLGSVLQAASALLSMEPAQLTAERTRILQYVDDLESGRERASDLLTTNQRIVDHPRWFDAFSHAGLELTAEREILYQGHHRCGLSLVFRKPDS